MSTHTIISLSGGLDSCTALAWAREYYERPSTDIHAAIFRYGSKHNSYEKLAAMDIARHYDVPYRVIDVTSVFQPFRSDLLQHGGSIPEGHYEDSSMSRTVVPARNIIFTSILAGLAESEKAKRVVLGIHQGDHTIYPDCRPEFYEAMRTAVRRGTGCGIELEAPFLACDKGEIVQWGINHKVPYHLTRTCYKDQAVACGKCGSCTERLEAFSTNNTTDPVEYEE